MLKEPLYKYVPTFRDMDFIFPEAMKAKEKQAIKKNLTSLKPEGENA